MDQRRLAEGLDLDAEASRTHSLTGGLGAPLGDQLRDERTVLVHILGDEFLRLPDGLRERDQAQRPVVDLEA